MSQWNGVDLRLKADRGPSNVKVDTVAYAQAALTSLGYTLRVDGQFGPKTRAAVLAFQTARRIPTTGMLDQRTWCELDWLVYDGWTACKATLTTHRAQCKGGCSAIVAGCNYHTGNRVNDRGLTREAQRLSDVVNDFVAIDFRRNRAVDRNARGSVNLSRHALGEANDDMTDLDRDGVLEPHEYAQCDAVATYLVQRAQTLPLARTTRTVDGTPVTLTHRGPDRLTTIVWTNHRLPDGSWLHGDRARGKDWSWSPARGTWKPLSNTIHRNHLHIDVAPGAPA